MPISIGSKKYSDIIKKIQESQDAKKAMIKIVSTIKTENKKEFDDFNSPEVKKLNTIIEYIVDKMEYIDKDTHYLRNNFNKAFKKIEDLINYNKKTIYNKWILLPPEKSAYHMNGVEGIYNLKFISNDGHFEGVFDKEGVLLTQENDIINMGTYNYSSPFKITKHAKNDLIPYYIWGNVKNQKYEYKDRFIEVTLQAIENLNRFRNNANAVKRYNEIYNLTK